jgi:hypothetical protein
MIKWNYISVENSSSGYEDVLYLLKSYSKGRYENSTEDEKELLINEVFKIYRDKNIFPITYYNEDGIIEEIQKCINKEVSFDGDTLDLKFNQGQSLCRFLFPNLQDVVVRGLENNSPYYKFNDDHKLYRAIKYCLDHKTVEFPAVPTAIKDGLEMLGGGVATNFKTMNAKALFEKYCPENGFIYDYSCGYGGRMLGALTSKNNYKYFGVEPNEETYNGLIKLGHYIEKTTGRKNSFKIYKQGSEEFEIDKDNFVDFSFSSPPYFNLEKYSNDGTQCYNKFPTLEKWFSGYVSATIQSIYNLLKEGRYYAVNIADFNLGKETIHFVDRWIELSENHGFKFEKEILMKLQIRRGSGNGENVRNKKEGIYVFKK